MNGKVPGEKIDWFPKVDYAKCTGCKGEIQGLHKIICYLILLFSLSISAGCGRNKESAGNTEIKESIQQESPVPVEAPQKAEKTPEKKSSSPAKKISEKIKVTFVELGSVQCIPCKMMQPIMKEIEKEYGDRVKVVFYDVRTEEGRPYAEKYGIRVIPTQVFLDKDGNEYYRHEGYFSKDELVKILKIKGVQ